MKTSKVKIRKNLPARFVREGEVLLLQEKDLG